MPHRPWIAWACGSMCSLGLSGPATLTAEDWTESREKLVQLVAEGVQDLRVVAAVAATERHRFVPAAQQALAYFDMSLPIGGGVTISPPYMVAFMTAQLEPQPTDRVLEIGTGSGYQAALLSPLVDQVYTIEILEELGKQAADRLRTLGYHNVQVRIGDGFLGWPEQAPFDKIIVTCSPEDIPEPLIAQLKDGGKLLIPLGNRYQQSLCLITKRGDKLERQTLESTFFVPMTGRAEVLRQNQQDDGSPLLVNGGFETQTKEGTPAGWYYLRQAVLGTEPPIPSGTSYLRLSNETSGRPAQALQAIGLDGRRYREVEISVAVRHRDVVLEGPDAFAGIELRFFDENRAPVGTARLGSWQGTGGWAEHGSRFRVPAPCRLVVVGLGLFGATGDLALDSLSLQAHEQIAKGPFD